MFDGMPDQFYQFLAAATTTSRTTATTATNTAASLPLPLSFSLHHHHHHHHASFPTYSPPPPPPPQPTSFDAPYHLLHPSQFLPRNDNQVKEETLSLQDAGITPRSLMLPEIPWSNDEMLALFRIRSTMDNTWFPDFIWENVSRKLAELGFKRSAEKCKEKFEEEFNCSIVSNNCSNKNNASHNNYRLFGELEELCINNNNTNTNDNLNHGDHHQSHPLPPSPPFHDHPQTSLSQQRDECPDEDEDEDIEGDQVEEKEIKGGERLGDDEEEEVNARNDNEDDNDNNNVEDEQSVDEDSEKTEENTKKVMRKRKRQKKFEMFKGFCEKIVNKMMAQQEKLHCKILQDMVKRDEEKIAREEAWKQQEVERLQKELEVRAHEQAIVGDRQAKILDCLNKFSSSSNLLESPSIKETLENLSKVPNIITLSNSSILTHHDSISAQLPPTSCTSHDHTHNSPLPTHQTCPNLPTSSNENVALLSPIRLENSKISLPMSSSSMDQLASQNPNHLSQNGSSGLPSLVSPHKFSRSDHTSTNAMDQSGMKPVVGKDDTGRRWPRDEVLALINIRCSLFNNNSGDAHNDGESFSKGPLWERISQKMMELGYKRSAKRCKEKWENINKYFRKTKDLNKKRSIDSRTCPYFHQLSHLYSQGTIMGPIDRPMILPGSPENSRSVAFPGAEGGSSATNTMHASQNNEGVVQVPGFDFEF